jgi:hypothetical protein
MLKPIFRLITHWKMSGSQLYLIVDYTKSFDNSERFKIDTNMFISLLLNVGLLITISSQWIVSICIVVIHRSISANELLTFCQHVTYSFLRCSVFWLVSFTKHFFTSSLPPTSGHLHPHTNTSMTDHYLQWSSLSKKKNVLPPKITRILWNAIRFLRGWSKN